MNLQAVRRVLTAALETGQDSICDWIAGVQAQGKTTKIESTFAKFFNAELSDPFKKEQPLTLIQTQTYYEGRKSGRLDCYIEKRGTALEYKSLRLPRHIASNIGGSKYDIGQIAADYLRLSRAKKLENGYVVAFLYGPLVEDADTPGKLYRSFHNQMFVDFNVAMDNGQISKGGEFRRAFKELEWDTAWGSKSPPSWAAAVKVGLLGGICIDCRAPN